MKIKRILQGILESRGFSGKHTEDTATVFANNSLDGVYSHGVNRFPRAVEYLGKGEIDSGTIASCGSSIGTIERQNGHRGFGPLNAKLAMDRAVELAEEYGVGVVALRSNNHWARGDSYGWQTADRGCIDICRSNTMPNMPVWDGKDRRIGNNPSIMSIPGSSGKHAVIDCAVSQFSYGRIEEVKLKGQQLPVPGGYDTKSDLTTDLAEIERTWRVLSMGYWKGSGISTALDPTATVLTNGNSVSRIGTFGDEVGLSQIMVIIDPLRFDTPEETDFVMDEILADIKSSEPTREDAEVYYPGELELITRENNTKNGIPVIDEVWETLDSLERQEVASRSNIEGRSNSWDISQEY